MRSFIGAVPLSFAGFVLAVVIGLAFGSAVSRRLNTSRFVASLLLFGFGFVIAATLTPDLPALAGVHSDGTCDLSRIGFAPLGVLTRVNVVSLNVLLFVPLGIAVGLLPRSRASAMLTVAAFLLPVAIEATQLVVTALGRGCETADIFDNLLGLAIGIGAGLLIRVGVMKSSSPRG